MTSMQTTSLFPTLSGGFAKVSFKPLNQRSNNKKNQSWKVPIKREQSEARFDSAEHEELRPKVKVLMKPEAGKHPSYPVVERSWDVFFAHL